MFADGSVNRYQKKEILTLQREMAKLELTLGGIKDMDRLPQLAFIIDPNREEIAVKECRKLGIPIVAVTDTNCDPDEIDYVIPRQRRRHPRHQADLRRDGQRHPGGQAGR